MFDLTQWFTLPSTRAGNTLANGQAYGRETHHLEGTTLTGAAAELVYHLDTGGPPAVQFPCLKIA
jgi:hypothetical protein